MARNGRSLRRSPGFWASGSLVFATAASTLLLVLPTYEGACIDVADYGTGGARCPAGVSHTTLLEENGSGVLWVLATPVALAALGALLATRGPRVAMAIALAACSLITGFSIGGAYLPATIAMAFAARRTPRRRRTHGARGP